MKKVTRFFLLLILLLLGAPAPAQQCYFDQHSSKGGHYFFRTYYQNYSPAHLLEGDCITTINGKPYAERSFKGGLMQKEVLYDPTTFKVTSDYRVVKRDSTIAFAKLYDPQGRLTHSIQYYLNKSGRRCTKTVVYESGVKKMVSHYATLRQEDLAAGMYSLRPEHLVDQFGFIDISVPFGQQITYHPNGKLEEIKNYQFLISDSYYDSRAQHGPYLKFAANGQVIVKGQYKDGQQDGVFLYYFDNGKKQGERYFLSGIHIGVHKTYHANGYIESIVNYSDSFYFQTGHERRYSNKGQLVYDRCIRINGSGYEYTYSPTGVLLTEKFYDWFQQSPTSDKSFYADGRLRRAVYMRSRNDTLEVAYYENGILQRINLRYDSYRQEITEFYKDGKPASYNFYNKVGDSTIVVNRKYYESGMLLEEMKVNGDIRTTVQYWSNGNLRSQYFFRNELLNGWVTVQDSSGRVIKRCEYDKGYRTGNCEVDETFSNSVLNDTLRKYLRRAAVAYYNGTYKTDQQVSVVDSLEFERQLAAIHKAVSFLIASGGQLRVDSLSRSYDTFTYYFSPSDTITRENRIAMDSILNMLGMIPVEANPNYGVLAPVEFKCSHFYNASFMDSIFSCYREPLADYFYVPQIISMIEPLWGGQHHLITKITKLSLGYVIVVGNNSVVVYNSGAVELFNGADLILPFALFQNSINVNYNWKD